MRKGARILLLIYEAENHIDAQLAHDELIGAGIDVVMKGQYLSGAAGELPASGLVTLWLKNVEMEKDARDIIAEYENRKNQSGPAQTCEKCSETVDGNFTHCWNCGSELPMTWQSF